MDSKKQRAPPTYPPSSSSVGDEEEDEVSSSCSDQKELQSKPLPPFPNRRSKGEEDDQRSSEDEEEHEEEENHLPVEPTTSKKPASKSEKKETVDPSEPPNPHGMKPKGKSPIVRFWSIEDEITILQAMLHHQPPDNVRRIELNARWVKELYDSIRKSLSVDADTAKLIAKMRRLKKKYIRASKRGDKLKLVTDKDRVIYSLSDKIWGKGEEAAVGLKLNGNLSAATASKGRSPKRKSSKRDFPFIRDALGGGDKIVLEMLAAADENKVAALEKCFRKLRSAEISLMRKAYKLLP